MKESAPNHYRFYNKWTIQRKNKWRYMLKHGIWSWVISGFIIAFTSKGLTIIKLHPFQLISMILVIIPLSLIMAHFDFKRNEKYYQTYLEDDKIIDNGVTALGKEKQWVHENLTICCTDENSLVIRNNLYWLKKDHPTEKQLSECMQTLEDDLLRLKRNTAFSAFAEGRKIKLQLYNNEDKAHPIAEKNI
jgi:hypothetical protein